MKITNKTTKEELLNALVSNKAKVARKDKTLAEQVVYAIKNAEKATKRDLTELVRDTMNLLGDKFAEPVLAEEAKVEAPKPENSAVKKTLKKKSEKTEESKVEEPEEEESEETEVEEPKKSSKKGAVKKTTKKTTKKDDVASAPKSEAPEKVTFPETLEVNGETYTLASDSITDMKTLHEALNAEKEVLFAYSWTRRDLKIYPYFPQLGKNPKSFKDDLDLTTAIYVSDGLSVAYSISLYTEACYNLLPEDFSRVDGAMYAGGIPFEVYVK